jgi:hypothetical protein
MSESEIEELKKEIKELQEEWQITGMMQNQNGNQDMMLTILIEKHKTITANKNQITLKENQVLENKRLISTFEAQLSKTGALYVKTVPLSLSQLFIHCDVEVIDVLTEKTSKMLIKDLYTFFGITKTDIKSISYDPLSSVIVAQKFPYQSRKLESESVVRFMEERKRLRKEAKTGLYPEID